VSAARPLTAGPLTAERLVIASHNEGKVAEFRALLEPLGIEALSAASLGLDEPEETGGSFRANAEIKARTAAAGSALPALADDSGLVVAALAGAPGIRSARWAGPKKDFRRAMKRIEDALRERGCAPEGARAHFVAALSLCWPDGHCESFEGRIDGRLTFPPRGEKGFGYDPIFIPEGSTITLGEMKPEKKHAISHRARAFERLVEACFAGPKAGAP
jgi:XTP/dITP diphosphohydrolase